MERDDMISMSDNMVMIPINDSGENKRPIDGETD